MLPKKKKKGRILLESGTNEVEFLRLYLGKSFFGINVSKIRKAIVLDQEQFSPLPNPKQGLIGNYLERGECFPVIDLKTYLNILKSDQEQQELLLICEFNCCTVGFVIDSIRDIMRCSWEDFEPSSRGSLDTEDGALTGNVVYDNEITPILDVEKVLSTVIPSSGIARELGSLKLSSIAKNADKNIVYCEDSPTVQRVLLKCLSDLGFTNVHTFGTGQEGLEYLKQNFDQVDLVISDIEMPRMDGLTLCREVRKSLKNDQIPFLFFSSTVTEEMKEKCKTVGGTASFSKPEISDLTSYLTRVFDLG